MPQLPPPPSQIGASAPFAFAGVAIRDSFCVSFLLPQAGQTGTSSERTSVSNSRSHFLQEKP